ncbi:hypothetical protein [Pseudonocardia sp. MH-G8]|uniref:hypothetical protein n=1 Tax=Pseudonocardia sp. MH-G8 TaxID=1854588 RepID=UPI0013041177|nr:hypothetical protein [Pseudonocardia sp. MH-G8]
MTPAERAVQARRDAVAERVRTAPPLSARQRDTLSGLLRPVLRGRRLKRAA